MEKMKIIDAPESAWRTAGYALLALDSWDWSGLIEARSHADSVGHIFDPTGYRALMHDKNAARNLELAKAIDALLHKARETHPEIFAGAQP